MVEINYRSYGTRLLRMSSPETRWFGQVIKAGNEWHAEMRDHATGNIVRFAGIWKRRRDAVEEVASLLNTPEARSD